MSENMNGSGEIYNWARGINAVTLFAEDLGQMKEFYQRVFELPIHFEDADSVVFKFGDTLINILKISEADELIEPARVAARQSGSRFVITIGVKDVDAICASLLARGVQLLNGPMDRPWGSRTASFVDPAGCIWEIANR